jgi:hypothetical protein
MVGEDANQSEPPLLASSPKATNEIKLFLFFLEITII